MLAHQERGVPRGAEARDIRRIVDSALAHQNRARRHVLRQFERGLERDFESREIPIVDADQIRAGSNREIQFPPIVYLDQRAEPVPRGRLAEIADLALREDGRDQQNRVRPVRRSLQDLQRDRL